MKENASTSHGSLALAFMLTGLCAYPPAYTATLTVTHFGDDIYCDVIGCSLRDAMLAARSGDTIVWANGLRQSQDTLDSEIS